MTVIKSMCWMPQEFGKTCPECSVKQPIEKQCDKCKLTRRFSCFEISENETTIETYCYKDDDWKEWSKCRYCSDDFDKNREWYEEMQNNDRTVHYIKYLDYLTEKYPEWKTKACSICNVEDKHKIYACFLCGGGERVVPCVDDCQMERKRQMDCNWFCDPCKLKNGIFWKKLENYCYNCKFPQPLAKKCRTCNKSYRFSCFYPHQCIAMFYPNVTDNVKYNTCPDCLIVRRDEDEKSDF